MDENRGAKNRISIFADNSLNSYSILLGCAVIVSVLCRVQALVCNMQSRSGFSDPLEMNLIGNQLFFFFVGIKVWKKEVEKLLYGIFRDRVMQVFISRPYLPQHDDIEELVSKWPDRQIWKVQIRFILFWFELRKNVCDVNCCVGVLFLFGKGNADEVSATLATGHRSDLFTSNTITAQCCFNADCIFNPQSDVRKRCRREGSQSFII